MLLELLWDAAVELLLRDAPRPIRVGCWVLLATIGLALLTIGLWGKYVL